MKSNNTNPNALVDHNAAGAIITQRPSDGYVNITSIAKATGKLVANWSQTGPTHAFLEALSSDIGIPISLLVVSVKGVKAGADPRLQGTWVHPLVAVNFATWASPEFAVLVSKIVMAWSKGELHQSHPDASPSVRGFTDEEIRRPMTLMDWQHKLEFLSEREGFARFVRAKSREYCMVAVTEERPNWGRIRVFGYEFLKRVHEAWQRSPERARAIMKGNRAQPLKTAGNKPIAANRLLGVFPAN